MAYTFGEDFLEDLRRRCSIEDVVGRYVELKKSGSSLVGLCPFHSERTPSFHVTPSKQMFYCFGCNTGGDVITFIMSIEHLSYVDAVQFLAGRKNRAGLSAGTAAEAANHQTVRAGLGTGQLGFSHPVYDRTGIFRKQSEGGRSGERQRRKDL